MGWVKYFPWKSRMNADLNVQLEAPLVVLGRSRAKLYIYKVFPSCEQPWQVHGRLLQLYDCGQGGADPHTANHIYVYRLPPLTPGVGKKRRHASEGPAETRVADQTKSCGIFQL
jgi:hypothetical protein